MSCSPVLKTTMDCHGELCTAPFSQPVLRGRGQGQNFGLEANDITAFRLWKMAIPTVKLHFSWSLKAAELSWPCRTVKNWTPISTIQYCGARWRTKPEIVISFIIHRLLTGSSDVRSAALVTLKVQFCRCTIAHAFFSEIKLFPLRVLTATLVYMLKSVMIAATVAAIVSETIVCRSLQRRNPYFSQRATVAATVVANSVVVHSIHESEILNITPVAATMNNCREAKTETIMLKLPAAILNFGVKKAQSQVRVGDGTVKNLTLPLQTWV